MMIQTTRRRFPSPVAAVALACVTVLAGCNAPERAVSPEAPAQPAQAPVPASETPAGAAPQVAMPPVTPSLDAPAPQVRSPEPPKTPSPVTAAIRTPQPAASPVVQVDGGLPPGVGRDTVQRVCTACHAIEAVTAVGRTSQGWADIIVQMQNMGLSASDEDLNVIHAYLSRELPPR